jgi:hypothetical protein
MARETLGKMTKAGAERADGMRRLLLRSQTSHGGSLALCRNTPARAVHLASSASL